MTLNLYRNKKLKNGQGGIKKGKEKIEKRKRKEKKYKEKEGKEKKRKKKFPSELGTCWALAVSSLQTTARPYRPYRIIEL